MASRWAWGICWLMFACTALNYMDRQAMSLVGPEVKREFKLDNVGFGWVMAAFQLTYALFQWPAGYIVDRRNVRNTYALAVVWWSLAGIATAFSPILGVLIAFRAILGMGESFNWPCALRVTAGILPPADRSLGNGIFNSGAAVGAVLTPLVVAPLTLKYGWRVPFVILGALGLVWVGFWLIATRGADLSGMSEIRDEDRTGSGRLSPLARKGFGAVVVLALLIASTGFFLGVPSEVPKLTRGPQSIQEVASTGFHFNAASLWWGVAVFMVGMLLAALVMPRESLDGSEWAKSLGEVVRNRRFWIIAAVGITINVTWHFLASWMGTFFQEERKLGLFTGAMVTSLPFLAADVGNLAGGALTRRLAARGRTPAQARKIVMIGCLALVSLAIWVGFVRSDALVILLLCLTAMGTAAYMVNFFAFGQDVSPRHTGLVIGYLGGLGNLFAAGFTVLAGWISQQGWGFTPDFIIIGLLPLIGLAALLIGWKEGPEAAPKSA